MKKIDLFRPSFLRYLLLVAGLAATAVLTPVARASTITVNTTGDELNQDGDCSLREAIRATNLDQAVDACPAGNGADTILVPPGTYALALSGADEDEALTGDLDIREDVTIVGAGRRDTIIDANGLDRVFHITAGSSSVVELSRLTVTGGSVGAVGGGIYVESGTVTFARIAVRNNQGSDAGGLSVDETAFVSMVDSRVSDNLATDPASFGGGIDVEGTAHLVSILIDGNTAASGGGIHTSFTGHTVVVNSTISGNNANRYGGGVQNHGITSFYNVTIVRNRADFDADDIGNGGGVQDSGFGDIYVRNSIIADNSDLSNPLFQAPDCSGTLYSYGYNLIEDMAGCTLTGTTAGNITGFGAGIGPLANNGGPTLTHALLAGSPAIDAGHSGGCASETTGVDLTVDQRGFARPVDGEGDGIAICDMGAFERLSAGPPTPTATATSPATETPTSPATPTVTATSTASPSPTPTNTATPTPTLTATAGPSPTPTNTATFGPSPMPTNTATATPELPPGAEHRLYLPLVMQ